jgi:chorismate mutase
MTKWLRYFLFGLVLVSTCRQVVAQAGCFDVVAPTKSHATKKAASNAAAGSGALSDLGKLIDARLAVMQDVARYKWNSHAQIEDPVREQKLLDSVKSQSETMGLPSAWTLHFFREQMEAAKLVQYQLFAQWRKEHQGTFANTVDLGATIRPQLDALTPRLLQAISKSWSRIVEGDGVADGIGKLKMSSTSPCAAQLAILPLIDSSAQAQ